MMTLLKIPKDYHMSLFFSTSNQTFLEMQDLFWVGMMGKNKQLSQRHFPSFSQFEGKGGEAQPLWVKGFRSHFNWLADIITVRQKTWSGLWTWIHLLNDWHLRDWHQENKGRVSCSSPCHPDLYFCTLLLCVCVLLYEEERYLFCLTCRSVCVCKHVWACMNTHMHVIVCACLWLCGSLSFNIGMCLSFCLEVHKYTLQTVWVFVCVSLGQGWLCVSKIRVCLCFLSVCGNVSLSPTDSTLLQFRGLRHFSNSIDRWDSTDYSVWLKTHTHLWIKMYKS